MSSNQSYDNESRLSFDVLQEIAQYCDKETLQAYCSSSHHLRQAVAPFFFRAPVIKFGVRHLRTTDIVTSQQSYQAWTNKWTEKFEQLSASGYAKYVHKLSYIGFTSSSDSPNDHAHDVDEIKQWKAQHYAAAWPIFTQNLNRYSQLKELTLDRVDIDDRAIIAMGTLQSLQYLTLHGDPMFSCSMDLAMHHNVRPTRGLTYWPLFDPHDGTDSDIGAIFVAGACSKITSLEIVVIAKDGLQDNFYRILNNCPLLEELKIELDDAEDSKMADRPTTGLKPTALPRLWHYDGPDYYASTIIKGRPVHKIVLYPCPSDLDDTNVTDWFQSTFSGTTVAVNSFSVRFFPEIAVNDLLRAIPITLPSLEELEVEIEGHFDEDELDSLVEDLHTEMCVIPASLKSLSLFWNFDDSDITDVALFEGVRERLTMPERLRNLEYLAIGTSESEFVFSERSKEEPREWKISTLR